MKVKISKSQWESVGQAKGWISKEAQGNPTPAQISGAFSGAAEGIAQGGKDKAKEYAQRIMNGEKKESVLQGQGPTMIKTVEQLIAQGGQPQAKASGPSYSLTKSQQWADGTANPAIMEYVGKVNREVQNPGGAAKYSNVLHLIIKAMQGDKAAFSELNTKAGGQAQAIAASEGKMTKEAAGPGGPVNDRSLEALLPSITQLQGVLKAIMDPNAKQIMNTILAGPLSAAAQKAQELATPAQAPAAPAGQV